MSTSPPPGAIERRANHDRRSAYPDRRIHLFDRRTLPEDSTEVPPLVPRRPIPDPMLPVVAIAILTVADVVTTNRLADLGGSELNPVSQWLIDRGWLLIAKIVAVGALAALASRARRTRWIPTALWAVAGVYAAVIALHGWQLLT